MTLFAKFAGTCKSCGGRFAAGTRIDWQRGVGARHETVEECEAAVVETLVRQRKAKRATALRAFTSFERMGERLAAQTRRRS